LQNSLSQRASLAIVIALSFILSACQNAEQKGGLEHEQAKAQKADDNQLKNSFKALCKKSASPVIKDKSKLKAMLVANGKITGAMTDEMANKIVSDYIRKKQSAFKNCKK